MFIEERVLNTDQWGKMMNTSFVMWTCNKCQELSDIPVDDFLDPNYEDGKPVQAACENCGYDSVVTLKEIFKK